MANYRNDNKSPSATKRGPGRFHEQGHQKATPPKAEGAGFGFELHKASDARRVRREVVRAHGRRQALKAIKHWRAEAKLNAQIEADERAAYVAPDA